MFLRKKTEMIAEADALPGRAEAIPVADAHAVLGNPMKPPFPDGMEQLVVGMGCFWGAERFYWQTEGVYTTACLLYTSPSPRDLSTSRMPSSA